MAFMRVSELLGQARNALKPCKELTGSGQASAFCGAGNALQMTSKIIVERFKAGVPGRKHLLIILNLLRMTASLPWRSPA